jgi:Tfp pilus assembly protein PilX
MFERSNSSAGLLGGEEGIALPVAVAALMIVGALAGAAATSAVTATRQSSRDGNVKAAVAASDAGLQVGVFRLNKFANILDDTGQCVVANGSGTLVVEVVQGDGWCRAQTEDLGQGASFSYRVSARKPVTVGGQQVWQRDIVSTGLARGVQRRAATTLNAPKGTPLFVAGVFSDLDLNTWNSSQINSNVRSNGNVNLNNSALICGSVMVGPGKSMSGGPSCGGGVTQATEPFVLSTIALPAANDNARIDNGLDPKTGNVAWNAGTRVLTIDGGTLTLRGSSYVFCSLHLTKGARLIIEDDGTPVKIYIDAPENCSTGDPSPGSVLMEKKGRIDTLGPASLAQVYMTGSNTIATGLDFENNEKEAVEMALYAPRSTFTIRNYGFLIGGVAAKQVSLQNNSEIRYDSSVAGIGSDTVPLQIYSRQSWVECSTTAGAAPNSNC